MNMPATKYTKPAERLALLEKTLPAKTDMDFAMNVLSCLFTVRAAIKTDAFNAGDLKRLFTAAHADMSAGLQKKADTDRHRIHLDVVAELVFDVLRDNGTSAQERASLRTGLKPVRAPR